MRMTQLPAPRTVQMSHLQHRAGGETESRKGRLKPDTQKGGLPSAGVGHFPKGKSAGSVGIGG